MKKSKVKQKSVLSDEQYKEMEKRWKNHISGKSKSYTIEQVRRHVMEVIKRKVQ